MVGDYARFTPPADMLEDLKTVAAHLDDLSPAMERGSAFGLSDVESRLGRGGDGDWAPLADATVKRWGSHQIGVGKDGGFGPTLRRDWSKKNFIIFTRAPHAHLFGEGRDAHYANGKRVNVYNQRGTRVRGKSKGETRGGGHIPKGQSLQRLIGSTASQNQPGRGFMYFSENVFNQFRDVLFRHTFEPFER